MLSRSRLLLSLNRNASRTLECPDESVFLRIVRWRKRRWAELNPSKQFYVREPTPIDPQEWKELRDGYAKYARRVKAVRRLFLEQFDAAEAAKTSDAIREADAREWAERLKINDKWNAETGRMREAHYALLQQQQEEEKLKKLVELEEKQLAEREAAAKLVLQEQEAAKHFVKLENLEEAIEAALNTRKLYNFVIDEDGNRYFEQPDGTIVSEETLKEQTQTDGESTSATQSS